MMEKAKLNPLTSRKKTGILVKLKYLRLLKATMQNKLLSQLNVGMKGVRSKSGGLHEIVLIEGGSNPKFDEAKVLIQNSVHLIEGSFQECQNKQNNLGKDGEKSDVIELEDVSSDDDVAIHLKENINGLEDVSSDDTLGDSTEKPQGSASQIICEGNSSDAPCIVTLDTRWGPAPLQSSTENSLEACQMKDDLKEISMLTTNMLINQRNTQKSLQETTGHLKGTKRTISGSENRGALTACDDSIIILDSSPKRQKKLTSKTKSTSGGGSMIILPDDTILISSCSESEEDILIEKIVSKDTPPTRKCCTKKRKLKSPAKFSTSAGSDFIPLSSSTVKKAFASPGRKKKLRKLLRPDSGVSGENTAMPSSSSSCPRLSLRKEKDLKNTPRSKKSRSEDKVQKKIKPVFDKNVINSDLSSPAQQQSERKTGLRPIIIDGQNLSREPAGFNFRKLMTGIKYFQDRNHQVIAFLPRHMQGIVSDEDRGKMWQLENQHVLCFTPSRKLLEGRRLASYDDRFIVQTATELGGVIVSNDNFRDLMRENERWKETVEKRLLMYTWVGSILMFPNDPLGKDGPHLDDFLRFPEEGD